MSLDELWSIHWVEVLNCCSESEHHYYEMKQEFFEERTYDIFEVK